jgi:hypothetical protein
LLNLGVIHYKLSKFAKALSYFTQASQIFDATLGKDHPSSKIPITWIDDCRKAIN